MNDKKSNEPKPVQVNISKFIKHLGEENYAEANKYLKKAVEDKLSNRIKDQKNISIFNNE